MPNEFTINIVLDDKTVSYSYECESNVAKIYQDGDEWCVSYSYKKFNPELVYTTRFSDHKWAGSHSYYHKKLVERLQEYGYPIPYWLNKFYPELLHGMTNEELLNHKW